MLHIGLSESTPCDDLRFRHTMAWQFWSISGMSDCHVLRGDCSCDPHRQQDKANGGDVHAIAGQLDLQGQDSRLETLIQIE